MRKFLLSVILGTSVCLPTLANALSVTQSVQQEITSTNEDGTVVTILKPAELVAPGENVIYSLTIENDGVEPATNMVMTMPVPNEVTYIEGTAEKAGTTVTFSVDGGQTFSNRSNLQVFESNGVSRLALAKDITHIRWNVAGPLSMGSTDSLSFKSTLK